MKVIKNLQESLRFLIYRAFCEMLWTRQTLKCIFILSQKIRSWVAGWKLMVIWFGFFEVVNPWVPCSFRNYKKRCVPLRLRSSIRISLEICFDWKSEIEDGGQGAIIRQWWSQFPRSFCPTVLHRAGLLLELKRTTLFGRSRKIINCPPMRLPFFFFQIGCFEDWCQPMQTFNKTKINHEIL